MLTGNFNKGGQTGFSSHRRDYGLVALLLAVLLAPAGFAATPVSPIGFTAGDQWEPVVAADGFGHVYILYPQYSHVPNCRKCLLPSMILLLSDDYGATWQPPCEITPPGSGQYDPQIMVDPNNHRTVYAAWLQNRKHDLVVAKSADFGQSWSVVIADRRATNADKPVLAVRGSEISVGFSRDGKLWAASSHDDGITFASTNVSPNMEVDRALPGGATIDPEGNVYLAWAGYTGHDVLGNENLYISKRVAGTDWQTWLMAVSGPPLECSVFHCDWGYLRAQITVACDAGGTLYASWNSSSVDKTPQRIYFASSTTAGETWSPAEDVSSAARGVEHAFPALLAGDAGDVRIAWMDTRSSPQWNTYYRSSTNGGATWSKEARLPGSLAAYLRQLLRNLLYSDEGFRSKDIQWRKKIQ